MLVPVSDVGLGDDRGGAKPVITSGFRSTDL